MLEVWACGGRKTYGSSDQWVRGVNMWGGGQGQSAAAVCVGEWMKFMKSGFYICNVMRFISSCVHTTKARKTGIERVYCLLFCNFLLWKESFYILIRDFWPSWCQLILCQSTLHYMPASHVSHFSLCYMCRFLLLILFYCEGLSVAAQGCFFVLSLHVGYEVKLWLLDSGVYTLFRQTV